MVAGIVVPIVASFLSSTDQAQAYRGSIRPTSVVVHESTRTLVELLSDFKGTTAEKIMLADAINRLVDAAENLRRITPPDAYTAGHQALVKAVDQYALAARVTKTVYIDSDFLFVSERDVRGIITELQKANLLMNQATRVLQEADAAVGLSQ